MVFSISLWLWDAEEHLGQIGSREQGFDCRDRGQRADRTRPIVIALSTGCMASRILGLLVAANCDGGVYAIRVVVVFPDVREVAYDEQR
ncbi:hypothetical protein [Streptomyces brevispora]|uniref:hypothetical protein n=1 Tax=Streptomyces brevispora TaxID=887462 RepID=UPI0011A60CD7|nr:hypothetical protein [Streptomyces brevispora]